VLAPAGLLSTAFGIVLLLYPAAGLLALVWLMGVYAVMLGIIMIAKAWLLTLSSRALVAAHR
jgi:uncharacterized membrane protein HdeD (DUF308 family)